MKFLCLAYGKEAEWVALPEAGREELLRQDDVSRQCGASVFVVGEPTAVPAWDGPVHRPLIPTLPPTAPLVGSRSPKQPSGRGRRARRRYPLRGGTRCDRGPPSRRALRLTRPSDRASLSTLPVHEHHPPDPAHPGSQVGRLSSLARSRRGAAVDGPGRHDQPDPPLRAARGRDVFGSP